MKKVYVILSTFLLLSCSSGDDNIEGYIVYKSYTPEHMCHDDNVVEEVQAGILYVHTHTHVHHHERIEPSWKLYVGNAKGTEEVEVTRDCWNSFNVTDKVLVHNDNVELVRKGCR